MVEVMSVGTAEADGLTNYAVGEVSVTRVPLSIVPV